MITSVKPLGTSILERIGNTPLVRLERLTAHLPGSSDLGQSGMGEPRRIGEGPRRVAIVTDAQRRGLLTREPRPSGRNQRQHRHRLCHAGRGDGLSVTLCMPSNVSAERKRYLAAYGAEIVWTNPADGSDGAIRKAREMVAAEPDRYLLRRPVFERRELEGALPDNRQTKSGSRPKVR